MNGSTARVSIHGNMDTIAIELDALDGLVGTKKIIDFCIKRMVTNINKKKEANQELEVNTKHAA